MSDIVQQLDEGSTLPLLAIDCDAPITHEQAKNLYDLIVKKALKIYAHLLEVLKDGKVVRKRNGP